MSSLAQLRAQADLALTEDAPPAHAAARERLLQHYRNAVRDNGPVLIEDIEWIAKLARAGHVPASALLSRFFERARIDLLLGDEPDRVFALAPQSPTLARRLAWRELRQSAPDVPRLFEWLERGGEPCRPIAVALRELAEITGATPQADMALVSSMLFLPGMEEFGTRNNPEVSQFLLAFALRRSDASDEKERQDARRLLERAAALGCGDAADVIFAADFAAAADKAAFVQAWLAAGKPMSPRACVRVGAHYERESGLAAALAWYERALQRKPWNSPERLDMDFCYSVAHAFDRRWSYLLVDDAELAVRWHARAAELGDERSLDTWLDTCVKGQMGLAADPDAALELVRRFRAAVVDLNERRNRLAPSLRALRRGADTEKDPVRAAKWRDVVALIENG